VGNNLYGSLKQLQILKAKNWNLKVLLSIGGWTYTNTNKHMDGPMATAEGRQRFASSCVELIRDYGFDGIDVDWEYPKDKEQGHQWLELLKEIRSQMNKYADKFVHKDDSGYELKPKFLLTIASPAGEKNYRNLPLREISEVTDFINLMAYDYAGSWDKQTGHNSNLYPSTSNPLSTPFNTASVLAAYNAAGVPSSKLNLGMPLYGRSFTNTQGVGKSFDSTGEGSFEKGIYDFKDLPVAGAQEYYDEEVGASYSYDEGSGTFVSYDTVAMALKKVDYIAQQKLGGAMWWEISGDKTDNAGSIVQNVIEKMRGGGSGAGIESSSNWLLYPDSKFDNIRNGVLTPQVAQRLRRA
jgi:chitinase